MGSRNIQESVFEIIENQFGSECPNPLSSETKIKEEPFCDVLDHVELIISIEDEWDIVISDEEADKLVTAGDFVKLTEALVKRKSPEVGF